MYKNLNKYALFLITIFTLFFSKPNNCGNFFKNFIKTPKGIASIGSAIVMLDNIINEIMEKRDYEKAEKEINTKLKDAPQETKDLAIKIAKKLKMKNPESISVKTHNSGHYAQANLNTIMISENLDSKHLNALIGHELSHIKHKDNAFRSIVQIIANPTLYYLHQTNRFKKNTALKKISGLLFLKKFKFLPWFAYPIYATQLLSIIIGHGTKFFGEFRADIKSASLGKEFNDGAIDFFKKEQLKKEKIQKDALLKASSDKKDLAEHKALLFLKNILKNIKNPHPQIKNRIKYLEAYKKYKYKEPIKI